MSFVIDGCQERNYFSSCDSGYNTYTPGKALYSEAIDQHKTEFVVLCSHIFVLFISLGVCLFGFYINVLLLFFKIKKEHVVACVGKGNPVGVGRREMI